MSLKFQVNISNNTQRMILVGSISNFKQKKEREMNVHKITHEKIRHEINYSK